MILSSSKILFLWIHPEQSESIQPEHAVRPGSTEQSKFIIAQFS